MLNFLPLTTLRYCLGCGAAGQLVCQQCMTKLDFIPPDLNTSSVLNWPSQPNPIWVACEYEGLAKRLVQAAKYQGYYRYCQFMAQAMSIVFGQKLIQNNYTLVPVPISKSRRRWRGYNQSELITKELGTILHLPFQKQLTRIGTNQHQAGKNRLNRQELADQFELVIQPTNPVCLVDDVITTGSTLNHCASCYPNDFPVAAACFAATVSGNVGL